MKSKFLNKKNLFELNKIEFYLFIYFHSPISKVKFWCAVSFLFILKNNHLTEFLTSITNSFETIRY